jgi:transaldolase
MQTKFLLDSGDPQEYRQMKQLLAEKGSELWGSTTNPSLIAKKLTGQKVSFDDAFSKLQRQIIEEILSIVPGAVSGEVYAAKDTKAEAMVEQGRQIATWGERVVVKLPTTLEGFKARTELRKEGICINNTLVFSQQQVFAITLHEKLMNDLYGKPKSSWPTFISPFVGRLDDIGEYGMDMVQHSVELVKKHFAPDTVWMLEASVRTAAHFKKGLELNVELETVPAKVFVEWFGMTPEQQNTIVTDNTSLKPILAWEPSQELLDITTIDAFMQALESGKLDIIHPLTDKGIDRFVADWSAIISS